MPTIDHEPKKPPRDVAFKMQTKSITEGNRIWTFTASERLRLPQTLHRSELCCQGTTSCKHSIEAGFVSGHDFSRAAKRPQKETGL
jgi:hypothetical protein